MMAGFGMARYAGIDVAPCMLLSVCGDLSYCLAGRKSGLDD